MPSTYTFREHKYSYIHHQPNIIPQKNPKLRSLVSVPPLLSRVSSLHFQKHHALLRSASIWGPETTSQITDVIETQTTCNLIYCMCFLPSQANCIAVDVLSLTKIVTIYYVIWESKQFHTKQFPIINVCVKVTNAIDKKQLKSPKQIQC